MMTRQAEASAGAERAALRVLFVEDDADDATLIARALERGSYDVQAARVDSADSLRAALKEEAWHVILCDYELPGLGGLAAIDLVAESGLDVPIIVVSGAIDDEIGAAAMKAGAHDFVQKDNLIRLLPAVERELREASGRRTRGEQERLLAERAHLAALAADVGEALTGRDPLPVVIQRCAEAIVGHLDAAVARIWTLSPDDGVLELRGSAGAYTHGDEPLRRIPVGRLDAGRIAAERRLHVTSAAGADPRLEEREWAAAEGLVAFAGYPLIVDERLVGVMTIFAKRELTEPTRIALGATVAQIALGIEQKRAQAALRDEAVFSARLADVGRDLLAAFDRPGLLERLCELTVEALGCDASHALILDEQGAYVPAAQCGDTAEQWETLRLISLPPALVEEITPDVASAAVMDFTAEPSHRLAELADRVGVSQALCMALRRNGELLGLLTAEYRGPRAPFTPAQMRLASGIAQLAVPALTNALQFEEVQGARQLRSHFVGNMSHELRTPLNILMGYNDLLLEGAFGELTPEQAEPLRRMASSAHDLFGLVVAILDVVQLEQRANPLKIEETDVAEMIRIVEGDLGSWFRTTQLAYSRLLSPDLPPLRTDRVKLKLVLKNLLDNAFKFTPSGGVSITAAPSADGIEIVVADTGIGIEPGDLSSIFEAFRQVDGSMSRRHGGLGLGLYLVHRLVELLGGRIDVESETGLGSTFRLWLPVAAAAAPGRANSD